MKKSNLTTGFLYVIAGIVFLLIALFTDTRLNSLLFGFAGAAIAPGSVMIYKYYHWSKPENKEAYQEILENEMIDRHDELKIKLRDKSGRYAYILGIAVNCIAIVVFSVLGALQII